MSSSWCGGVPADLVLDELEVAPPEGDPDDGANELVEHLVHVAIAECVRNARPAVRTHRFGSIRVEKHAAVAIAQVRTGRRAGGGATRVGLCPAGGHCMPCRAGVSRPPRSRSGCAAAACPPACLHYREGDSRLA